MIRRIAMLAPFVLAAGCAAPPPAAPAQPPAEAAPNAGAAAPSGASKGDAAAAPAAAPGQRAGEPPPPPPARAAAASDAPILTKITQDDILAAVNKNGDDFNKCYTLGAGKSKSYRAKVTVKATVGPTGVVNTVEVVSSTAKNPKVDACVMDAFKKISFNRAPGQGATVFTFPLNFDGLVQVQ